MAERNRVKMLLNALLSAADPEIRVLAEKIGASIPEKSWFRSAFAERLIGVIKGLVESRAEGMNPIAGALLEKLTDLFDFAGSTLFGKSRRSVVERWMQEFVEDGVKRIQETDNPQAEFEQLEKELRVRQQLISLLEEAAMPVVSRPTQPIDISQFLEKARRVIVGRPQQVARLRQDSERALEASRARFQEALRRFRGVGERRV